jgi:hypothetical protein
MGRGWFSSNFALVQIIIYNGDIQDIVYLTLFYILFSEISTRKEAVVIFAVCLLEPILPDAHERIVAERLWLMEGVEAEDRFDGTPPCVKPAILQQEVGRRR